MRGAFAYQNFNYVWVQIDQPPVSSGYTVSYKYSRNENVFPTGKVTVDNSFENLATQGSNAEYFGWRGATSGKGSAQFGQMLSNSKAFSRCMVRRAIETVCLRKVAYEDLATIVLPLADQLEADQYNMRRMFARVAANTNCIDPTQAN